MNSIEERLATLELCDEAEKFFASAIGRYVLGVSDQEVAAALEELKHVDPGDAKTISALQVRIATAEGAILWLAEAIHRGRQEMQIIHEEESGYGT